MGWSDWVRVTPSERWTLCPTCSVTRLRITSTPGLVFWVVALKSLLSSVYPPVVVRILLSPPVMLWLAPPQ